jgi:M6 family metalloprotease-like protein
VSNLLFLIAISANKNGLIVRVLTFRRNDRRNEAPNRRNPFVAPPYRGRDSKQLRCESRKRKAERMKTNQLNGSLTLSGSNEIENPHQKDGSCKISPFMVLVRWLLSQIGLWKQKTAKKKPGPPVAQIERQQQSVPYLPPPLFTCGKHGDHHVPMEFKDKGVSDSGRAFEVFQCIKPGCAEFIAAGMGNSGSLRILFRGRYYTPRTTKQSDSSIRFGTMAHTACKTYLALFLSLFFLSGAAMAGSATGSNSSDVNIPDGTGSYVHSPITISSAPSGAVVTRIDYSFAIVHTDGRDLDVDLNDNTRTTAFHSDLWRGSFYSGGTDSGANPTRSGTITTGSLIGLPVNQTWYLAVADSFAVDTGYINSWTLTLYWADTETITTPASGLTGEPNPVQNTSYAYTIGASTSSLGHTVEYSFNWGDGTSSSYSTSRTASHSWSTTGQKTIIVTARCQTHTNVSNNNSPGNYVTVQPPTETITTPASGLTGEPNPVQNTSYAYTIGASTSSLSHTVEYSFNWGDGTSSSYSTSRTASHSWSTTGQKTIIVTARCQTHTSVSNNNSPGNYVMVVSPPPSPDLVSVTGIPATATVGQPFTVTITAQNTAGLGGLYSAINSSVLYSDGTDDLLINNATASWADNLYNFAPGTAINNNSCVSVPAGDHLVEAADNNWTSGEQHSMSFSVTPSKSGTIYIRARVTLHSGDSGCNYVNDTSASGGSTSTDQQGWAVKQYAVTVQAMQPYIRIAPLQLNFDCASSQTLSSQTAAAATPTGKPTWDGVLRGMSASPFPFEETQPDGSRVTLFIRGGVTFHWLEDTNGFTVIRHQGSFVYAQLDGNGALSPTSQRVGKDDPRRSGIKPRTLPSAQVIAQMSEISMSTPSPEPSPLRAASGNVKNVVILMRFANHVGRTLPTVANFNTIFNSVGGDPTLAPSGSVRDVYFENSYGVMTLNSTVFAWVTLPHTEAYYADGASGLGTKFKEAITDALNLADPLVNFSQFDDDLDGFVDAITFIHSGYGAESGGSDPDGAVTANRIWSHRSAISTWTSAEGVKVRDYDVNPAFYGITGSQPTHIGVICHETGHFFGLPDLYDTDHSSGGIGSWCMMANSWGFNNDQLNPPHFSAWCKIFLGWVTPTVISASGTYTASQAESNPSIFRINNGYPSGEYLLIENRQSVGFDRNIPQGGLAVWHVDENKSGNTDEGYPGQTGWPANGRHFQVSLLQADGNYDLETQQDRNRGDSGDLFRSGGVTEVSHTTVPNTDGYQGGNIVATGNRIYGIGSSSSSMNFSFSTSSSGGTSFTIYNDGPGILTVSSIALDQSSSWITWSAPPTPFNIPSGGSQIVTVSVDCSRAPSGQSTRRLIVYSNDSANSPYPGGVNVTVTTPAPAISITPASQDFGSIQTSTTTDRSFTVKNTGGGTLSGSASVSSPFSIVSGSPYNLSANQSAAVTVRYSPTAIGSDSQNVSFTGGGGATRPVSGSAYPVNISVTVQASPSGRSFTVDGTTYTAAQTFNWIPGSGHTIATTSLQSGGTDVRYVWTGWSDGGGMSHTVSPTSGTIYTVNFTTQFFLTMNAGNGGSVSPSSGWNNSGAVVPIIAAANSGYSVGIWTGSGAGSYSGSSTSASVTMNGPINETASFTLLPRPFLTSMEARGDGRIAFQIIAPGWTQLVVQAADNPSGPWLDLATVVVTNGNATFIDNSAGTHDRRFYRTRD